MIAPISGSVPSAHGLVEGLKRTPAEVAFIVPSIVQELSQNLDLLDYCAKHLEMILYCGGDLPQSIGDVVASRIPLFNQFGASELGLCAHVLPTSHRDPQDWGYIEFHPEMGVDLRHVTEGMHELYIKRNPELEEQQPSFALFPDQQEYSSRDLFVRHRSESKPNLWRWKARADDIIVFLNGEKTNPISMEQHISSRSPEVSAALVTGAQRFQAALLIETTTGGKELSPLERATLIEELWPIIEEANRDCPAHARIAKTHILFTHFDKPMARAGKGTVQRAGTLQLYANEIDALYADADTMLMANEEEHGVRLIDPSDTQAVSRFMKEVVLEITSWSALDDTVDLLSLGIDSLQILTLVRKLRKGLQLQSIAPSTIYKSPSIAMLADAILRLFEEQLAEKTGHAQSRLEERASLLKEFEDKIDQLSINLSRMVNGTPASNIVSLPRQPLPTLNATLELYLDSAKPFLSKLEFKKTSNVIRDFAEGIVEHLQKRLENREQDPEIDNWQHDLQVEGIYLKRRDPIHPYGIFYGVHLPVDVPHSQSERAAVICLAVSKFKRLLGSGKAEQETLNEEPLCMNTLQYLFNTNREPRLNIDIVQKYPGKSYIVVIRRGHAFKLMTDERTTLDSLKLNFDAILRASEQDILPVASLTIDERNSWAILREEVQKVDASNKATLATIEAAAFIVCLDDEAPSTPSERCNQFLIGNPSNRWADKSLQFIICSNGVSGYICEHSMLDAISIKQLNNHVTEAIQRYNPEPQLHSTVPQGFIEELTFKTTAAIESQIYKVSSEFRTKHSLRLEFSHYSITTATPAFFSSHRIPAKPGCQLIIQLASLLHFGIQYPAWEVVTLAPFLKGRLDWMQVVSPAMHAFCSAASSTTIPVSEQRRLLKEAIRSHTATLIRISRGKGFAAHLEALQQVLRQDEEVPEVFRDSSWQWMRVTASRKLKTDASDGMLIQEAGYLMPDPKSLFLHYEAIKGGWKFFVQGTEGVTERFCLALEKAAEVVRRVVESGCEEGG